MSKEMLVFAGAFAVCAALGASGAGCSDDDGACPSGTYLPVMRQGYRIVSSTITSGDTGISLDLRGGTLDVTGETLVLRYTSEAVEHEVVYKVFPHPQ